jgi:hypothetical protein
MRGTVGEAINHRTARYWLDDEGILRGVLNQGVDYGLADAMEMMAAHRQLTGGRARGFLMDIRTLRALPHEVRTYFTRPEHVEVHRAVALLVGSPLSRAIGNFFLGFNKPAMPMRLFSDEESALEWLRRMAPQ